MFYYGNLGTSKEARQDNAAYKDGIIPMSMIYFFAALSIGLLLTIYVNAIFNCLHINAWCKDTQAMINHSTIADKKKRYLQLTQ